MADNPDENKLAKCWRVSRTPTAYWILGLCNNFGYVVMLSSAHDILVQVEAGESNEEYTYSDVRECNAMSTGIILLADIVPAILVKLIAPFLPFHIDIRIAIVIVCSAMGFLLVGVYTKFVPIIFGVLLTSFSSGLGESSLLGQMSRYNTLSVISTWSSGTGGAGIFGATAYSVLITVGLTPKATILSMLSVPALMGVAFWIIAKPPPETTGDATAQEEEIVTTKDKIHAMPLLMKKYMAPYALIYFSEYLINQGLYELIYIPYGFLDHKEQYRWYSVMYQMGVFISRSSVNIITIDKLWLISFLQVFILMIMLTETLVGFMNFIFIVLLFISFEGLLAGAAYVNCYRRISNEIEPKVKKFCMSMNSLAGSSAIAVAALLAIPLHNAICKAPSPYPYK